MSVFKHCLGVVNPHLMKLLFFPFTGKKKLDGTLKANFSEITCNDFVF